MDLIDQLDIINHLPNNDLIQVFIIIRKVGICHCLNFYFRIDQQKYGWCAYVLCGIRGALEKFGGKPVSLRFAIAGTIPPGSGLSSSSAVVSASLLATTYLNKVWEYFIRSYYSSITSK